MNFLPIATRELQVTARRPATYYWRSFTGLNAACLTLGFIFAGFSGALTTASAGEAAFDIFACAGYVFAACAAALLTADCISEERREGTLGLLLLTYLTGFDVVLGKLSRLANPLFCLAAAFPTMGFAMILGGVSAGDFAGVGLALLNTLFFFAALGLLISARTRNGRQAVAVAISATLIFSSPGVLEVAGLSLHGKWAVFLVPTPAGMFLSAMGPGFSAVAGSVFWWSFMATQVMAWAFLAAASHAVTRIGLEEEPKRALIRQASARPSPVGLEMEPLLSLVVQSMSAPSKPLWSIVSLGAFVTLMFVAASQINPAGWFDLPTFAVIAMACHLVLKFPAANNSCRCLPGRRRSGELELLLTTPLDEDAVVRGSAIALKRQLLWPVLFVLALDAALLVLGWWKAGFWDGLAWAAALFIETLWFLGNLYSLTWLGLCLGLKSASHSKALGRTLFYILFMPASALAAASVCFGIATMGRSFTPAMSVLMVLVFLVMLAVCNLGFAGWAMCELRDRFRILAAQQQAAKPARPPSPLKVFMERWLVRLRKFEEMLNLPGG